MLAKICCLIVSLGIAAGVLLHLRQARLQAVHELARVQLRMNQRDRDLLRVRTQIARHISPEKIEDAARTFGPIAPIGVEFPAPATAAPPAPPAPGASTVHSGATHPQER